jgi:hypothetical protein
MKSVHSFINLKESNIYFLIQTKFHKKIFKKNLIA